MNHPIILGLHFGVRSIGNIDQGLVLLSVIFVSLRADGIAGSAQRSLGGSSYGLGYFFFFSTLGGLLELANTLDS